MRPDKSLIENQMERFQAVCKEAGIRLTPQRLEVFRELAQACDHPDAETVFQRIRVRMPTVSLDTVYRTLWMLHDLDLVTTLGNSRERTRFDANRTRHHHFVCVRCGLTRDFYSDELNELDLPESARAFGEIRTTHVQVRGVCRKCAGTMPARKGLDSSPGKRQKERKNP